MDLDAIALAGAAATERFVAESKQLDKAWRDETLAEYLTQRLGKVIDEYGRDDAGTSDPA